MRKHLRLAAFAALVAATPLAAQDGPAALVIQVQGDVQLHQGGGVTAATVGSRLTPGDEVVPAVGARAILLTRTGAQQVVTQATTIEEPRGAGNPDLFDRAMARFAQAASTDARNLGGRQGMIRPIPGEPTLVAPRNGLTVTTSHPTFSWMGVDGKDAYTIQIRNVDGGRPQRFQVTGTTFTLPESAEALEPGANYAWTVAPDGGRATREVQFKVIGAFESDELATTLSEVSALGLDPMGDGAFLTVVIYRDLDLFYDAATALANVENTAAMSADLYLLKGEILAELGQADEARAAFDKADAMMR
jgi:hypothetical protein